MKNKTLKQLREEKKITQMEMAKLLGIAYQTYRAYEGGYFVNMKPEMENKIGDILNCDYSYNR